MTYSVMAASDSGGTRGARLPPNFDAARLTAKGLDYLERVIDATPPKGRNVGVAVAAAGRLLEWARWREERDSSPEEAITALMGSPEKALAWMETMIPRLRAKVRGALVAPEESIDGEVERTEADTER